MADSTSPALNRTLDTIGKCTGPTNYREWKEIFLIKTKPQALDALELYNTALVIPNNTR